METRKIGGYALDETGEAITGIENRGKEGRGVVYKAEALKFSHHVVLKFPLLSRITLIIFLGMASLHAQNPQIKFERIGLEQGLSQATVTCTLQDRHGFMWFGTQDGLNKYDGYRFTVYKHDVTDSSSISDNYILSICEDHEGKLWIGTLGGGLNRFDCDPDSPSKKFNGKSGQFVRFINDPKNPSSLSHNRVFSICESRSGRTATLWIGTKDGLNRLVLLPDSIDKGFDRDPDSPSKKFNGKSGQFTRFAHDAKNPNSLSYNIIRSIYEDRSGTLWIGTEGGGLNRFDRDTEQFTHFRNDPKDAHSLSGNNVLAIYEDHFGVLWIGTAGGGLNRFDRDKEQFTHFTNNPANPHSLSHNTVRSIYEDRSGTLWIGTAGGGLNSFDRVKEQFTHFTNNPANPHSLSDNRVWSIYEDRSGSKALSGILWIGTRDGGLNKRDRGQKQFAHFANEPANPHSLSDNVVRSIYQDRFGALWIGTAHGLNRFDCEKEQFAHFVNDPQNPHSISHNEITAIYQDAAAGNVLWIGTDGGGLNKLVLSPASGGVNSGERSDRGSGQFIHFVNDPKNPHTISHNIVMSIYQDHLGILWIGTWGGLNKFDRATGQFTRFVNDPGNPYSLSENRVWTIYEDRFAMLWIGTNGGGLNRFDRNTGKFARFVNDPKNPGSLSSNNVLSICEDGSGALWIGTGGGGLNKLDCPDARLKSFNGESGQFTHYTMKDGLPDDVIYGILEDERGHLWLSTNKGLSRFDPRTKTFRNYDAADGLQSNEFNTGAYHKTRNGEMVFGGINGFNVFHPDGIKDNPYIPPVVITAFKRYNTGRAEGIAIEEKGISEKKEIELSYKDNILTFEFSALSYRNSFKNQYAYRLEGFNNNWIQLGAKRDVTFTNLDPGEYTLRVKGSNNDGVWNEEGTSLKITITPPWWKTWWAYMLYVLLITSSLYGIRRYELNRVHLKNQLKLEKVEAEKMKELDHLKSRFFANLSHEFRTPLTLILGPVEQMRAGEFKGNLPEAYDMILRNGRRLLRLINQLLDLAKLEAGRTSLQARPENIVAFLKGLVLAFASAAERKNIALTFSARDEKIAVYFDRDKLEKIVSNLLSNALKFTPEGGRVTVAVGSGSSSQYQAPSATATASANFVEISVTDTGSGIPLDQLDKIFDRFYQIDASHTREHEGTGIGLALTKELVELHHGEIRVQSEVGRGTTVSVRLPLGREHLKPDEVVEAAASEQLPVTSDQDADFPTIQQSTDPSIQTPVSTDETIVLVVDDNRDVRAYIRQYLEPAFKVVEAVDGVDGAQKALAIIPDLIISDVMMPKRDGNELCRILKTDEKTSHVPIILLTAKADRESKVQSLEIGADDYLIKPFDSKELLARVHNLVKLRRQLRERFSREVVLKPSEIAVTPMDEAFLQRVQSAVEKHLDDEDFGVETLAEEAGMSRAQLHRKLRALIDQSANQLIRSTRLRRAVELLRQNAGNVAEVAYMVGFGSQAYFTKCFHEQYGCSPKEYVKNNFY